MAILSRHDNAHAQHLGRETFCYLKWVHGRHRRQELLLLLGFCKSIDIATLLRVKQRK